MKKIITTVLVALSFISVVSAYNPPAGAENLFEYSSPDGLAGKQTVAGGAIFSAGSDSLVINPALAAREQRVNLNLGYTFLHSSHVLNKNNQVGSAFQTSILIPFKMFVFSGYINGTFVPFAEMNLSNSMNFKLGLSKEITDKLDVGVNLNTGAAWGYNQGDWSLSCNLGFNYTVGDLGFMKDFRYGISVLNLGKNYDKGAVFGLNSGEVISHFPTIATIKIGAAASLFKNELLNIGFALDLGTACFQNLMIDANAQFAFKEMFVISIGEKFNMMEGISNKWNAIPSIGLSFKFKFGMKNNQYMARKGWSESEMTVSSAYKNMYSTVNAVSVGVDVDLGMKDTTPPVIEFLD